MLYKFLKYYKISIFVILICFLLPISYINAQINTPIIKEGAISQKDRITFKKEMYILGINYLTKYLPNKSFLYNKKVYSVKPISIWWHWDAGSNPKNISEGIKRVNTTYNILKNRTENGQRVATNFTVGPNVILQMLPLSKTMITQGRLTGDLKIEDIHESTSLGGIQIETTGTQYDTKPPLASQTKTLIKLTAVLMKQYNIKFSKVYGHLEKSPYVQKIDPGITYLKQTRMQLLKYLINNNQLENIDNPNNWNFYTEVLIDGNIVNVIDQSAVDIYNSLTKEEQKIISNMPS
ncbi:MAG: hypothetical protein UR85_C0007G0021 [Candidatus Nomurabacteria bacterium GW2011_GWF2_35_66]|uniref:N-acetylmuramoyl-L-alanine amidase domain-containing protein n=1 Tax=Candidatus Nomurabacteria bacterium GW2011_GWE1_35_16 TaxID=1618761 RepID=A0A0G0BAN9_9BACT|nr:MAG: hypothetical protein UR55_C0009G0037 [Candidatus Nomurabacteria bacterium GW2011_GWF1_34_20]KKP62995.1 MAG: hypothetical protein UR57_C0009G0038 [Candidatus Nomurabacteria bacterium GW2011_GWE2_34_25]KKP66399.1 MAG: hypothetical protein UR64_C0008G0037 [Candidatus Nomurabacteria bacterium GW2011_GWE1_35_16]KKP83161.1 MAG: hypothetical protein UR85_C0007G0021 [Candidatus Nomurabacteria bacterium GW2011_GWF2_35_66]HAE36509.1 hypothetical protein [Candidatus Nomurabacteria bacterium]